MPIEQQKTSIEQKTSLAKRKTSNYVLVPFLIAMASAIGLLAGYKMNFKNNDLALLKFENKKAENTIEGGRIEEILRFIENTYVDSVDQDILTVDAINHILKQLDPHSSYITPEEHGDHTEKMEGVYQGLGIETIKLRDTFFISHIKKDSPAESTNLGIGDAILEINNDTVSGKNISDKQISKLLKKNDKESISVKYRNLEDYESQTINIVPEKVVVYSVDQAYKLSDETAYLNISRFNSNTYQQFLKSVDMLSNENEPLNLIIDLRDNPGGFLPQAINILSQLFNEKDQLLTYTEGLNRKRAEYRTTGKPFYNIGKVVVLQNKYSASASEIVAGAIQDWDRGFIVGESSYGKGLVQEVFPLNNGGALRLTVAMYYTPSNRLIQKSYENIKQDFEADTTNFLTKILNRKVIGGGGVRPDYFVEDQNNDYCYNYFDYIDYFLIDMFQKNKSVSLLNEQMTEQNLVDFINREYEETTDVLIDKCELNTKQHIEARLKRYTDSHLESIKMLNETDPFVIKALDIIEDKKTTLALLSEKN